MEMEQLELNLCENRLKGDRRGGGHPPGHRARPPGAPRRAALARAALLELLGPSGSARAARPERHGANGSGRVVLGVRLCSSCSARAAGAPQPRLGRNVIVIICDLLLILNIFSNLFIKNAYY